MRPHHERCASFPDACRVRPAPRRRSPWDRILDSFLGEPHSTEPCCTVLEEDLGSEPEGCAPAMYLSLGLPLSKLVKTSRGWRFGLCDETGMYTTNPEATHVGWTFDEEEPRAV